MSVDYEYTTIDVDILMHPKAIAAGLEAMGLWLWAMAWSHKTGANGKIPRHVVGLAWGGPQKLVDKLAKRLVTAGLWLATDDGWTVWNYGKKNQSAEEKERKRAQGRERIKRWRDGRNAVGNAECNALPNGGVTRESDAPDLICNSEIRSEDPTSSPRAIDEPANDTAPAAFWDGAIATVSAEVLGGKPIPNPTGLWFEYLAARSRKRWAMNHRDAVGWLSSVAPKRIREAEGGGFARASGGDTPGGSRWGPPTLKPGGDS